MNDYEGRSHGVLALYCFSPYFPRTVVCDTGCQSASWAFAHLKRFFHRWRFIVDQFHHFPHKCQAITKPSEFSVMRGVNDSFVEQIHAIQRALALTMQSTSRPRAMFLLQLLQYEIFCDHVDRASVPEHKRTWPDPATVPLDPVQAMLDVDVDIFGPDAAGTVANEEGATGEDDGREEVVEDEEETGGDEEVEEDEEETGGGEGGLGVEDAAGVDDEEADEEKDDSSLEEMLDGSLS